MIPSFILICLFRGYQENCNKDNQQPRKTIREKTTERRETIREKVTERREIISSGISR